MYPDFLHRTVSGETASEDSEIVGVLLEGSGGGVDCQNPSAPFHEAAEGRETALGEV
jgi:hypothetical protein